MSKSLFGVLILSTGVLFTGCATKKYVRQTVDPVSQRVDQVATQTNQQGQTLEATRKDVERNEQEISQTRETAKAADQRAGDAMNAANSAGVKADQANSAIVQLRSTIANIDDYKPAATAVVAFGFNKDTLTPDAKEELDRLAASKQQWKRYFIAVEGFTDRTGTLKYNDALSRRRAEQVVKYLVAKYDIPVYRIHEIGLGEEKLVDDGKGRAANEKNRRVEVTVFTADSGSVISSATPGAQ